MTGTETPAEEAANDAATDVPKTDKWAEPICEAVSKRRAKLVWSLP